MKINDNFEKLPESYLFSTVAARLRKFREEHPGVDVIRMDIGDVTLPIPNAAIRAMHHAVDDMAESTSFHGYGPEQGYDFLRNAIACNDYAESAEQGDPHRLRRARRHDQGYRCREDHPGPRPQRL